MRSIVSVVSCKEYALDGIRQALVACLAPLGGIKSFIHPGMRVLLKPNLLAPTEREQAVTTHPLVVQAVAELVRGSGGEVFIGDSPGGPINTNQQVWRKCGMVQAAEETGSTLILFDGVVWRQNQGISYFIARPVYEVDLVINLPKLKTHSLTLYTGAVKNLLGVIPGTRKSEVHVRAPGVQDFSRELVNLFELVRPGLTIMDGILGQEGSGPGPSGTPHHYGILAASTDPVALDSTMTQAMGYRSGEVLHLAQADSRGLGNNDPKNIQVVGDPTLLNFGPLQRPASHWYLRVPAWLSAPIQPLIKLRPHIIAETCLGCGKCAQVCPGKAIIIEKPVRVNLDRCVGCMCCAEVCPQAAVEAYRSPAARLLRLAS